MATYKKRGFKKKPFSNKIEDAAQKSATANVFNTLDKILIYLFPKIFPLTRNIVIRKF